MTNLERFIKENDLYSDRDKPLDPKRSADRKELREALECELSPENLCCDGELSGGRLIAKSRHLRSAMAELTIIEQRFLKGC